MMKLKFKLVLAFLYSALTFTVFAQEQFLIVKPNGHKASIRDVVVSNDGNYLITGSFDKSIKKWNLNQGETELEYHGKIGKGIEGSVYFIAISPDNKYVAAQGWFGAEDESEPIGDVRLYDYKTGKMVHVFHDLKTTPAGLGFSNDSKFLIAGDQSSRIVKWDLSTHKIVGEFKYHSAEYGKELDVIKVRDDIMVSVDRLGIMCVWDIKKPNTPITIDKEYLTKVVQDNYYATPNIDIAPGTHEICYSWEEFIFFMDSKLNLTGYFQNKELPGFVRFSPNGRLLLTGVAEEGTNKPSYLFTKNESDKWVEAAAIPNEANRLAGEFLDNNRFVYTGGDYNEITLFKLDFEKGELNDYKEMKSNGVLFRSVALNNKMLAYADTWDANFGYSSHNKVFDMFLKDIDTLNSSKSINSNQFNYPDTTYRSFKIRRCRVGKKLNDFNRGLVILENNKVIDTIVREVWDGNRHTTFGFTPKGNIISGGDYGILKAYNSSGFETNDFVGHTGYISGMSISTDKTKMVTSGADNTIRIWSLDKVGVPSSSAPPESVWEYWERMDRLSGSSNGKENVFHKLFKKWGIEQLAKQRTLTAWKKVVETTKAKKFPYENMEKKLYDYLSQKIHPIVTIFVSTDGEWIIYNEDGYFSASKKGAQYVGYHVNKGIDKEAKFYPFEQFDLKYNRPDIILKDLALGDPTIIDFYHRAYLKRLKKMHIEEAQLASDLLIPEIKIEQHKLNKEAKTADIDISCLDTKFTLDRINVYLNDVPVFGTNGISIKELKTKSLSKKLSLELAQGKNDVKISVLNTAGVESLSERLLLFLPETEVKPNLYLVTIGTSHYSDKRFDLKYAAKDATDIDHLFEKDKVYKNIHHKVLTDEKATKSNILALRSFLEQAGRNDVVMIFIAGHGLLDENFDYYYATYDIDFNTPSKNGIIYSQIEQLLDGLKALKKLLFMDTCHSGEVDKDDVEKTTDNKVLQENVTFRASGIDVQLKNKDRMQNASEMVKELFVDLRKGTGTTVISSAGGVEYAMESDQWHNGLFTYCLLHGLQDQSSDLNKDGKIMLSELQTYIRSEVKSKSAGKQIPTSRMENITLDYPIW